MHLPNRSARFTLKTILTLTASLVLTALPLAVSAQSNPQLDNLTNVAQRGGFPLGTPSIPTVAAVVINTLLAFVGTILLLIVIYAGFLWMTAAGSEEKIKKAKSLLLNGVIGLFIILAGYAISSFIISSVQSVTNSGTTSTPPAATCASPNACVPTITCASPRVIVTGACVNVGEVCCTP